MLRIIGDGTEIDEPSLVHEQGPSSGLLIDDALSRARCALVKGTAPTEVLLQYERPLTELIGWRRHDAEGFLALVRALAAVA